MKFSGIIISQLRSVSLAIVLAAATGSSGFGKEIPLSDRLDRLFSELQSSQSELEARHLAGQIDDLWRGARGETARLLLSRADDAIADDDFALAIDVLDQLIALEPDFAEAWNRRATVYYLKENYGRSLADIAVTLALEPRHFGALTGLGLMLEDLGEDKKAYDALKRALELNPFQEEVRQELESLERSALGQPI
uniref:tetratricopeptide repeat protein n=1 Tax=Pararhizobium sp. IMCC3301 TaxID=3067904 RepID=UPI002741B67D|nr:tetratricopeptide repeat protein [Pararhizobium sp. IMCC3301]